ncbi:MAG: NifU family protein [Ignavibacteriae bacterium]|nr:NifU family protein [Ignavibacteriota bacterium]
MTQIDFNLVEQTLESIRPFLKEDNGDIELVNITNDGIVEVKLIGACLNCPMSTMTLRAGVERVLMNAIPQIKRVESIN